MSWVKLSKNPIIVDKFVTQANRRIENVATIKYGFMLILFMIITSFLEFYTYLSFLKKTKEKGENQKEFAYYSFLEEKELLFDYESIDCMGQQDKPLKNVKFRF